MQSRSRAAWVLFYKQPSTVEVINDINKDVINLYRVLKHHLPEFIRHFEWALVSRDEFDRLKATAPETLTDVQRACRFYYLQQACFGGKVFPPYFGYDKQNWGCEDDYGHFELS